MPIEAFDKQNCAIARTLAFLGERWTMLVLREIGLGRHRFDEIQARLGVASNVLSARLATLVEEGILERRPYSSHAGRFEYHFTEKGRELLPVLRAMMKWGNRYKVAEPPVVLIHDDCGHEMEAVEVCSHCGGELTTSNVSAKAGPGLGRRGNRIAA